MSGRTPSFSKRDQLRNLPTAEPELAALLLHRVSLTDSQQTAIAAEATRLVETLRAKSATSPAIDALMREYDLSSAEGLALMGLAEALLRIPDAATRDLLIADKLGEADWAAHAGGSPSWLVNLSTRGLGLGAGLFHKETALGKMLGRLGAPVLRRAVLAAMKLLGGRFVFAETIAAALKEAKRHPHFRYSFDMLGESARTEADAQRYLAAYHASIAALASTPGTNPEDKAGISVKLSALHPRYEPAKKALVMAELLPRLLTLAEAAATANIGFTIDAEEDERLDLSLDLLAALATAPSLAGWQGLGLAVQAYNKRALAVIDYVDQLAEQNNRRLMVRLVKGAYWDSEIKHAQEAGLEDYPVYTSKTLTDLSYLACAQRLLAAGGRLFPQFASHNAYTVAAIRDMAPAGARYEFQRLHGMGTALAEEMRGWGIPIRVYAPVGPHEDLLAYLVRRLLENGANASFVNQLEDTAIPVAALTASPLATVRRGVISSLPAPRALYPNRLAAPGIDWGDEPAVAALAKAVAAPPFIDLTMDGTADILAICSPALPSQTIGQVHAASATDIAAAIASAAAAQPLWNAQPVAERAAILRHAATLLTAERERFLALLVHEAGRTLRNALGEVREATDFLTYYAATAALLMAERVLPGVTGETNTIHLAGRGVFACISPWNFPLAIFTGQVAAALATGNAVLAKPAEETPLIAHEMIGLLHRAGVPAGILHYLPGPGETTGAALVNQPGLAGVVFTGGTATAHLINRALAAKDGPIPVLIAETGGLNAMIVDSSALPEQVVGDIIASAFDSAGQRCSALRVLAVQDDIADKVLAMLQGAMASLTVGHPADPASDIGPVIGAQAWEGLIRDIAALRASGHDRSPPFNLPPQGHYLAPHLVEIDRLERLTHEIFGPVLAVIRWKAGELEPLIEQINDLGYGLTLGLHTRIGSTVETVRRLARVGNLYVNRSQIGAVVESQPFGGEGLSGTGPKAGGPLYLTRFCLERTVTVNTAAAGGNAELLRGK
jgi:RHH-type proline utilization regulon transcriptional repressor/proline dehydrogenase/delta 1-pyrroline-5-carboxylate dehydrogenase